MSKNKQTMNHLVLYQDDFSSDKIWRQVCDCLDVSPDEGDTVTVYWDTKADIDFNEDDN